jgi:hypothetical protein
MLVARGLALDWVDPYDGWTRAQLLAERERIQAEIRQKEGAYNDRWERHWLYQKLQRVNARLQGV